MTTVAVRQLQPADAVAASALLTELGYPVAPQKLAARIATLGAARGAEAFVAVADGGRVVGIASLNLVRLLTDDRPAGYLTSLVVAADVRGRGVGRLLVDQLCQRAINLGCGRVIVNTHLRRAGAHAFYERLGFEFSGRRYVRLLNPPD